MLRRTKALIQDQLPTKADHVLFCDMSPLQQRAYDRLLMSPDFIIFQVLCVLILPILLDICLEDNFHELC